MFPTFLRLIGVVLGLMLTTTVWGAETAEPTSDAVKTCTVSDTYNTQPFDYQAKLVKTATDYRVYQLTYPSSVASPVQQNNTIHADFYWPNKAKSHGERLPVVIALSGLDGNTKFPAYECAAFASRGMAAVTFSLPYYNERASSATAKPCDSPEQMFGVFTQAVEDVRRTVDLLASQPKIDPDRINLTGLSFGAIISATAAGKEPRLYRTCLFLGGGDLLKIIHHASYTRDLSKSFASLSLAEKAVLEVMIQGIDPLAVAPALKERAQNGQVLMINATKDEIIPRDATVKLATALGIAPKIVWVKGEHCTVDFPKAVGKITAFFAQDLPTSKGQSATAD